MFAFQNCFNSIKKFNEIFSLPIQIVKSIKLNTELIRLDLENLLENLIFIQKKLLLHD